jgi:dipeptide/tripeptide permease
MLGLPLLILAWALFWRRNRAVFWFALALIVVGTGYLMTTGATDDIANRLIPQISNPPPVRAK